VWQCPDFFAPLPGKSSRLDLSSAAPNAAKHVLKMILDTCYNLQVHDWGL
jgi:beta-fructofuranosidase